MHPGSQRLCVLGEPPFIRQAGEDGSRRLGSGLAHESSREQKEERLRRVLGTLLSKQDLQNLLCLGKRSSTYGSFSTLDRAGRGTIRGAST